MAEQERKTSAEGGGIPKEAPKDALSDVMQKLEISPEIKQKIQQLQGEKKERCQLSLEDILVEVEEQKLGPTDKEKKIEDTLIKEYNIKKSEDIKDERRGISDNNINDVNDVRNGINYVERFGRLSEKLDAVKKLNQTVVSEELKKAKTAEPLPQETKLAIAKATNTDPSQVDEAIKKGDNPQIQNLVDTYYLTNAKVQSAIESRLPEEEKGKSYVAFQELRGSAREFGVLSSFTPADLPSRLSDKSDKTQQEVISTFNSINKDNPNTLITRTGDKLNWEGTNGKKYEIDMGQRPPKLSKKNGILEVEQDIHDTKEVETQANTKREYREVQGKNLIFCQNIANNYTPNIQESIAKAEEKTQIPPSEIRELMNTLKNPQETLETRQKTCEKLITLYSNAESLPEFQPKMDTETLRVDSTLSENIRDTRKNLIDLQRGLRREKELQGKLPSKDEEVLTNTADWEANTTHNFERLNGLGLGRFQSMDEVVGFLQSQRGIVAEGVWSDRTSINRYLGSMKLQNNQLEQLLDGLVSIYDNITKEKVGELPDKESKLRALRTTSNENGDTRTALSRALDQYRTENGRGTLSSTDFERILSQKTP